MSIKPALTTDDIFQGKFMLDVPPPNEPESLVAMSALSEDERWKGTKGIRFVS